MVPTCGYSKYGWSIDKPVYARESIAFRKTDLHIYQYQPEGVDHCRILDVAKEQRTDSVRYTSLGFSYEVHEIAHTHV
jgi:hypothetical protein